MNLMGVVYIMIRSFFSLAPYIDSVISPLGFPMSVLPLPLLWAIVNPYRSIPIISGLTCCVSNHAASFHQPQIHLCTAAKSIYKTPVLSIFFFFLPAWNKITRETRRGCRVADEGWWSFRDKLLRTVKPMNRRDK